MVCILHHITFIPTQLSHLTQNAVSTMNHLMPRCRTIATPSTNCKHSDSTVLTAKPAEDGHFSCTAYFAPCDRAHLARCDFSRALHDITNLCSSHHLVRPPHCVLSLNPKTGLNLKKKNNPGFDETKFPKETIQALTQTIFSK